MLQVLIIRHAGTDWQVADAVARRCSHRTEYADAGADALERLRRRRYDAICADAAAFPGEALHDLADAAGDARLILTAEAHAVPPGVAGRLAALLARPLAETQLEVALGAVARETARTADFAARIDALQRTLAEHENENGLALALFERLTEGMRVRDAAVASCSIPAKTFCGDGIVAARDPQGRLNVMLVDATGHDLAAATTLFPVIPAFYAMTDKAMPVAEIAAELNRKLHAFLPRGRFVAATLAAIDQAQGTITVWNGANPPALLLAGTGEIRHRFASHHPALGVMADGEFDPALDTLAIDPDCQLVLFSDGVIEAVGAAGAPYGLARISTQLAGAPRSERFRSALDDLARHIGSCDPEDDMTFSVIDCGRMPTTA